MGKIKITVLIDNNAPSAKFISEKGLSLLIEDDRSKILFDTGMGRAFLSNTKQLGLNLRDLTHIVLSHGHYDHTGGLSSLIPHLKNEKGINLPVLVSHPDAFIKRGFHLKFFNKAFCLFNIGSPISKNQLMEQFQCEFHAQPFWIHEDLVFLGKICRDKPIDKPRVLGTTMKDGQLIKDEILDDSALAYRTDKGLVIVAGCAHSGICNIVEYAKQITKETRIDAVIGGFHLQSADREDIGTVAEYFNKNAIPSIHACHCTGSASEKLPNQMKTMTGSVMEW